VLFWLPSHADAIVYSRLLAEHGFRGSLRHSPSSRAADKGLKENAEDRAERVTVLEPVGRRFCVHPLCSLIIRISKSLSTKATAMIRGRPAPMTLRRARYTHAVTVSYVFFLFLSQKLLLAPQLCLPSHSCLRAFPKFPRRVLA